MEPKKLKIVMFHGRAAGHNIMPFLEYFNTRRDIDFTFCYNEDRNFEPKELHIKFFKLEFNPSSVLKLKKLLSNDVDIIWYHGGHSPYIFALFQKLRSSKTTFIFNVWNEWILRRAVKNDFRAKVFRWAIKKSDVLHCNWHGTAEVVKELKLHENVKVFYWGLHKDYFTDNTAAPDNETIKFFDWLPENKTIFFFPKSISSSSRHDLVIKAGKILKERGITNFKAVLWLGNKSKGELETSYETLIEKLDVRELVDFYHHKFIPFNDIRLIWERVDCGLQIALNEQLSTTFLEPQFFKKEIIVTDIEPYRIYNEKMGVDLPLIPLDENILAQRMEEVILGRIPNQKTLDFRSKKVAENFNILKSIEKITTYYEDQVNRLS